MMETPKEKVIGYLIITIIVMIIIYFVIGAIAGTVTLSKPRRNPRHKWRALKNMVSTMRLIWSKMQISCIPWGEAFQRGKLKIN